MTRELSEGARYHDEARIHNVKLGDVFGNDDKLFRSLDTISRSLAEDAPKAQLPRLAQILQWYKLFSSAAWGAGQRAAAFVSEAIKRFFMFESRQLLAEAEAERIKLIAAAEAERLRAAAEKTRAEAKYIEKQGEVVRKKGAAVADRIAAEAEEVRASTTRRDELLKKLKQHGIDWITDRDGDILSIFVTKAAERRTRLD